MLTLMSVWTFLRSQFGFVTNFSHKQLTRSAGRETGSTSDEENSRDIQILIWSHQNSCTCQKEDKLEDELVCQLAVDVYGHWPHWRY